jgi:hypothetical protein
MEIRFNHIHQEAPCTSLLKNLIRNLSTTGLKNGLQKRVFLVCKVQTCIGEFRDVSMDDGFQSPGKISGVANIWMIDVDLYFRRLLCVRFF